MIITLDKPIKIDEKEIKEINLNLEDLTGADILKVDLEIRSEGHSLGLDNIYNQNALLKIASLAAGIIPDDLKKLSMGDFLEVTFTVRNFLLGLSGNQEEQTNSETSSSDSQPQPMTE